LCAKIGAIILHARRKRFERKKNEENTAAQYRFILDFDVNYTITNKGIVKSVVLS